MSGQDCLQNYGQEGLELGHRATSGSAVGIKVDESLTMDMGVAPP